ncbi:MAG: glycosyl transferase group 1 [Blastococcus sp.]|nr:glycosyl transferase group 1 [Blastococcus sp.]
MARKGLLDLLEAVSRLPDDAATLHLVLVHGPLPVAQVAALYAAADVFALASSREPYGTVYGEAMAAGLPVVGDAAGNLPHLARDGEEGLVVPLGDVAALTAALRRIVEDEALRARLGEAAARRATTFSELRIIVEEATRPDTSGSGQR